MPFIESHFLKSAGVPQKQYLYWAQVLAMPGRGSAVNEVQLRVED